MEKTKTGKRGGRIAVSVIGICLWVIYLLEEELANYGIYTVISYRVHEIMTALPFVLTTATLIWLILLIVKIVKKKNDKDDIVFAVILLIFTALQGYYFYSISGRYTTALFATVESADNAGTEMKVRTEDGRIITMETPEMVCNMVRTDGTEYFITYTFDEEDPLEGKLQMISFVRETDPDVIISGTGLRSGKYLAEDMPEGLAPYIVLNEDDTGSFTYSGLSSELPTGRLSVEDNKLILTDDVLEKTYSFYIEGNTLVFEAEESADIPYLDEYTAVDGMRFVYQEERTEQ